ncbi:substrate-binding domain-containing protein [Notoacmeibacter sp. MSK16QG-6]|uniref:LacI family DNA-binding transcriptional regulator n=1 Tax=Notoacmeibacter sp. MSK16QG-6 TaxID=2957982 RepID=UPI00209DD20C|nr:LacI family DNA-binding transcriptional regulator [Notoacmeibacter sp. MSK16QG-6]
MAKAAGVSLATVDRVLNERPNVSRKTIEKVNEAVEKLGFVRNLAAVNLAKNRIYRFCFALPSSDTQYIRELEKQVGDADRSLKTELVGAHVVRLPMDDPHAVARYLGGLAADEVDGIAIMAPESPQVRDAMGRLSERGIEVVQFLAGQVDLSLDFIGVDNYAAGSVAGRLIGRFLRGVEGKVVVIADTMRSLDTIQRRLGLDDTIRRSFPNLQVLPSVETYSDPSRAKRVLEHLFGHQDDIVAVYVGSLDAELALTALQSVAHGQDLVTIVHERTPFTEAALSDGRIAALIAQDPGHAVRSAIRIMRARIENRDPIASQERIRIEIILKENM